MPIIVPDKGDLSSDHALLQHLLAAAEFAYRQGDDDTACRLLHAVYDGLTPPAAAASLAQPPRFQVIEGGRPQQPAAPIRLAGKPTTALDAGGEF